jgi:hypothetical protein
MRAPTATVDGVVSSRLILLRLVFAASTAKRAFPDQCVLTPKKTLKYWAFLRLMAFLWEKILWTPNAEMC